MLQAQGAEGLAQHWQSQQQQQQRQVSGLWLAKPTKGPSSSNSTVTYRQFYEQTHSGSNASSSTSRGVRECSSSEQMCVLQPLMVAAAAAAVSCQGSGSDLVGIWDMHHCKLLLGRTAAKAVTPLLEGANNNSSSSSSSAVALAKTGVRHAQLQHAQLLHVDLQQLRQLLLWAVLAPACSSQLHASAAAAALEGSLSAEALGVREQQQGVQVVGCHIADVLEAVAELSHRGQVWEQDEADVQQDEGWGSGQSVPSMPTDGQQLCDSRRSSTRSSGSDGDERSSVLLPLGVCLSLRDLCTALRRRLE